MENILANLQSTGVFLAVLSILIVVHEWGHFITAKWLGVSVEEFAVGFGPKLWSTKYNGTEYMLKLIPLGGYVKMAGDDRGKCTGAQHEFFSKSIGHRSLVVLNGPVVNFILAYVCFVFVFMLGYPDLSNKIGFLMKGYPAETAGLIIGDEIVQVDAKKVSNWTELQEEIKDSSEEKIHLTIVRDGKTQELTIVPKVEQKENLFGQQQKLKLIGIRPAEGIVLLKYDFPTSTVKAYEKLVEITVMTYKAIYFMLTGTMKAQDSMTGPIGIFYIIKTAAQMGFNHVLFIMGLISASLAIFNLLPVVPLDGGHLMLFGVEKLRGKALPAKIDEYIIRFGFSLIIVLAVFVFFNDLRNFGFLDKVKGFLH